MDIQQIINEAIPKDTCQVKEAGNVHRRAQLKKRIEEKIADAWYRKDTSLYPRDKTEPYKPDLEYKGEDISDEDIKILNKFNPFN